jgi:hypothetical protein
MGLNTLNNLIKNGGVNYGVRVQTNDFYHDTMLNYHLSQKFNLIKNSEFDHLINILT